ncbi:hypothetical protein PM708P2_00036 [Parabacteroides phage PM708P2]|nr:hypothetical protein PM708P2_00036 [Parabacteroides phage PM708P2]
MACLSKLAAGLNWLCVGGAGSNMARIEEAILINHSDIISVASGIPTMAVGAQGYTCNSVNNSIRLLVEMNAVESGRNAVKVTVSIVTNQLTGLETGGSLSPITGGRYAVALKSVAGTYVIAGAIGALEASEITVDSTGNGAVSFTLATPDWQIGSTYTTISKAVYDGFKIPKV